MVWTLFIIRCCKTLNKNIYMTLKIIQGNDTIYSIFTIKILKYTLDFNKLNLWTKGRRGARCMHNIACHLYVNSAYVITLWWIPWRFNMKKNNNDSDYDSRMTHFNRFLIIFRWDIYDLRWIIFVLHINW